MNSTNRNTISALMPEPIPVKAGNKHSFVDSDGCLLRPFEYDEVSRFLNDDYAEVIRNGLYGAIDRNGKVVIEPVFNGILREENTPWFFLNNQFYNVKENAFGQSFYLVFPKSMQKRFFNVMDNQKRLGVFDCKNERVSIPMKYQTMLDWVEGESLYRCFQKQDEHWVVLDLESGNEIFSSTHPVKICDNRYMIVVEPHKNILYSIRGEKLHTAELISFYKNSLFIVKKNEMIYMLDVFNTFIQPRPYPSKQYDHIRFISHLKEDVFVFHKQQNDFFLYNIQTKTNMDNLTEPWNVFMNYGMISASVPHKGTGLIDADTLDFIFPPDYKFISYPDMVISFCNQEGLSGFWNAQEGLYVKPVYKGLLHFSEGYAPVIDEKGRWGFIDTQNVLVKPHGYHAVSDFYKGLAWVNDEKYIDTKFREQGWLRF